MNTPIPTFEMYNGNGNLYSRKLPKIIINAKHLTDFVREHIAKQTGLIFVERPWNRWEAQPTSFDQFLKLFLTYNFKTKYYNNWDTKNTLYLRFDHHNGFDVTSICKACAEHNHIRITDIPDGARLAC